MALNREHEQGNRISIVVPEGTESGDPLIVGDLPCVALIDRQDDDTATVQTDGVYRIEVAGAGDVGDVVSITPGGALTMTVSGNSRFGYLLDEKASGDAVVRVKVGY